MYKSLEDAEVILEKLINEDIKIESVTRGMNRCIHNKDINQYLIFAKAKGLYRIYKLENK